MTRPAPEAAVRRVPAADGYRMPGEFEPHARCWMAWPPQGEIFFGELERVRAGYGAIARAIAAFEPVAMVADPKDAEAARQSLGAAVEVVALPLDDAWMRDMGPIFVVDGEGRVAGVHWGFNAWGERGAYRRDAKIGGLVIDRLGLPRYTAAPFVLEGGAIHVDGEGTLITTESCLLNPNRNPGRSRDEVESALRDYLGVETIIWLHGNPTSGTDGHVDGVACFVRPGVVLLDAPGGAGDSMTPILEENRRILAAARDARGRRIESIDLVQPARRIPMWPDGAESRLTYVNFYIANGGIVLPAYDDVNDEAARRTVAAAFPERRVAQIDALDIARGGGMIHCITQQQPRPGA